MGSLPMREASGAPKSTTAIATNLHWSPKLGSSKTQLATLVAEQREVRLELTWKFDPYRLAVIVPEGAVRATVGEETE